MTKLLHTIFAYLCLLLTFLTIQSTLMAQNGGRFAVRMLVQSYDCNNKKMKAIVQLKVPTISDTFRLGNANYRFTYNPTDIGNPTLLEETNFSSNAPSLDLNYAPQTLQGTQEKNGKAIVSLNTTYMGFGITEARKIDTAWQTVAIIGFEVYQEACFSVAWNSERMFPQTGMSATNGRGEYAELRNITGAGIYESLNLCPKEACENPPCSDTIAPLITIQNNRYLTLQRNDTLSMECDEEYVFQTQDARMVDNDPSNSKNLLTLESRVFKNGNCRMEGFRQIKYYNYKAVDACGNSTIFPFYVKIVDKKAPLWASLLPQDTTIDISKNESIPSPPTLSANDNCGIANVTYQQRTIPKENSCDYDLFRTWTAIDDCGNRAIHNQQIAVIGVTCCPDIVVQDTITKTLPCNEREEVALCLDIPYKSFQALSVTLDGKPYDLAINTQACYNGFGSELRLPKGEHWLHFVHQSTNCRDSVFLKLNCSSVNRPNAEVIANNDTVTTLMNRAVPIDVLLNDYYQKTQAVYMMSDTSMSVRIIRRPVNGNVVVENNWRMLYVPRLDYCGADELEYELCINGACDRATVHIEVGCDGIKIYAAISPNNDDLNEYFLIEGLEKYPEHRLYIFNRWGHEVYRAAPYRNDWRGTYENNDLPDGTYFYQLEDGLGRVYSGYLQIHR